MTRLVLPLLVAAAAPIAALIYLARADIAEQKSPDSVANELSITVDFGVLRQGESREHRCWLRNPNETPLEIKRFKSSCDCVTVRAQDEVVDPGEKTLLTLSFDGERDPDFVGSLGVSVIFEGLRRDVLGRLTTLVEVIPSELAPAQIAESRFPIVGKK